MSDKTNNTDPISTDPYNGELPSDADLGADANGELDDEQDHETA